MASMSHSLHPSDSSDSSDLVDQISHSPYSYSEDRNNIPTKQNQFNKSTLDDLGDTSNVLLESRSIILR